MNESQVNRGWRGNTHPQDSYITYPPAGRAQLSLPRFGSTIVWGPCLSQSRKSQSCGPKARIWGPKENFWTSTCPVPETFCRFLGPSLAYDWAPAQLAFGHPCSPWNPAPNHSCLAWSLPSASSLPELSFSFPRGLELVSYLSFFEGLASTLMAQTGPTSGSPPACCKYFVEQKPLPLWFHSLHV